MDRANAIIVCIMVGVWIRKIWRTSYCRSLPCDIRTLSRCLAARFSSRHRHVAPLSSVQTARRRAHGSRMPRSLPRVVHALLRTALPHSLYSAPLGIERCSWPRTIAHNLLAAHQDESTEPSWKIRNSQSRLDIQCHPLRQNRQASSCSFDSIPTFKNCTYKVSTSKRKNGQCLVNKLKSNQKHSDLLSNLLSDDRHHQRWFLKILNFSKYTFGNWNYLPGAWSATFETSCQSCQTKRPLLYWQISSVFPGKAPLLDQLKSYIWFAQLKM